MPHQDATPTTAPTSTPAPGTADTADRFVSGSVEQRHSITRLEFLDEFAGRRPLLLRAAVGHGDAVQRWSPEYLIAQAGAARLELLGGLYERGARATGFRDVREVSTTLGALVEALVAEDPSLGYLFNSPSSVLRVNPHQREFDIAWREGANPGLARLDADLRLPPLLRDEDLIQAFLILGGREHAAPLHYDLGGEAKLLVQVAGRKRVLLFPPAEARRLSFPGWFDEPQPFRVPHASDVDLHRPDFERFPDLADARCLEARMEPGDVLYWPPFWPHDVTNLDAFTVAVSCSFEELGASSMWMREGLGFLGQLFLRDAPGATGVRPEVGHAFRRLEHLVMSQELSQLRTFYGWHAKLFS